MDGGGASPLFFPCFTLDSCHLFLPSGWESHHPPPGSQGFRLRPNCTTSSPVSLAHCGIPQPPKLSEPSPHEKSPLIYINIPLAPFLWRTGTRLLKGTLGVQALCVCTQPSISHQNTFWVLDGHKIQIHMNMCNIVYITSVYFNKAMKYN